MLVALTLAVAAGGGLLARRLRVPGGVIVGAMLATAVVSQAVGEIGVPGPLRTVLFLGVGVMIGSVVTRTTVRALRHTILPALASAAMIVACGIVVALLLRALGIAPAGDMLATSPGALSVLTAASVEGGHDASTVALFHITRLLLIMLSLPLLTRLLDSSPAAAPTTDAGDSVSSGTGDDGSPATGTGDAPPIDTGNAPTNGTVEVPGPSGSDMPNPDTDDAPNPGDHDSPGVASEPSEPSEQDGVSSAGSEEGEVGGRGQAGRRRWAPARWRAPAAQLALTCAGAAAGGLALARTGVGGTLVLGSTVGAALVTLAFTRPRRVPEPVMAGIAIGLGWMVGALMTPETVQDLRPAVVPAVLAAVLLISSGIAISFTLRALGHAPPGDVLATSPGSMEAVAATAVERDAGPLQVALFHTVRVLVVILSLPLLLALVK